MRRSSPLSAGDRARTLCAHVVRRGSPMDLASPSSVSFAASSIGAAPGTTTRPTWAPRSGWRPSLGPVTSYASELDVADRANPLAEWRRPAREDAFSAHADARLSEPAASVSCRSPAPSPRPIPSRGWPVAVPCEPIKQVEAPGHGLGRDDFGGFADLGDEGRVDALPLEEAADRLQYLFGLFVVVVSPGWPCRRPAPRARAGPGPRSAPCSGAPHRAIRHGRPDRRACVCCRHCHRPRSGSSSTRSFRALKARNQSVSARTHRIDPRHAATASTTRKPSNPSASPLRAWPRELQTTRGRAAGAATR